MTELNTLLAAAFILDNLDQEIDIKILHKFYHNQKNHKIIRKKRCGKCIECIKPKCGLCINCQNKSKRKQRCKTVGLCKLWFLPERINRNL